MADDGRARRWTTMWSVRAVLPAAGMSVINGVVMRPSGRTCTFAPSSGLRQTKMVIWSSGPMIYSSLACCCAGIEGAGGRFEPPVVEQPVMAMLLALTASKALNFNDLFRAFR